MNRSAMFVRRGESVLIAVAYRKVLTIRRVRSHKYIRANLISILLLTKNEPAEKSTDTAQPSSAAQSSCK